MPRDIRVYIVPACRRSRTQSPLYEIIERALRGWCIYSGR